MCFHLRENHTGHFIIVMVFFDLCAYLVTLITALYCNTDCFASAVPQSL